MRITNYSKWCKMTFFEHFEKFIRTTRFINCLCWHLKTFVNGNKQCSDRLTNGFACQTPHSLNSSNNAHCAPKSALNLHTLLQCKNHLFRSCHWKVISICFHLNHHQSIRENRSSCNSWTMRPCNSKHLGQVIKPLISS